jgi:hypothetical protein
MLGGYPLVKKREKRCRYMSGCRPTNLYSPSRTRNNKGKEKERGKEKRKNRPTTESGSMCIYICVCRTKGWRR